MKITFHWYDLHVFVSYFLTFRVGHSVEGLASSLWVNGSYLVLGLLLISFVCGILIMHFGANVVDFEYFETVLVAIF